MTALTTTKVWTWRRSLALVLALVALLTGLAMFSTRAVAVFIDVAENGLPGHLSLSSDPYPAEFLDLSPGAVRHWQIRAELVDPSSPLTMQFKRDGALVAHPNGLTVQARLCSVEWVDFPASPSCPGTLTSVFGPVAASSAQFGPLTANADPIDPSAPVYDLGTLTNAADKYLLVTLAIPNTPAAQADQSLQGLTGTLGFGLTARESTTPTGGLPNTGSDPIALLLTAFGALGVGLVVVGARRAREAMTGEGTS